MTTTVRGSGASNRVIRVDGLYPGEAGGRVRWEKSAFGRTLAAGHGVTVPSWVTSTRVS